MVTVYTKPNCVQCNATKNYLDAKGVEYNTVDITKDPDALDTLIENGFKAAPVVNYDGEWWAGFQPDLIDKKLVA
jgi:glutaredoxin-like protein NrdH